MAGVTMQQQKNQISSEYSLTLCRSNRILLGVGAIIVVETLELTLNVGSDGLSRSCAPPLTHSMTAHLSFPVSSLRAMSNFGAAAAFMLSRIDEWSSARLLLAYVRNIQIYNTRTLRPTPSHA